jgi:flagellar export protein FliJ
MPFRYKLQTVLSLLEKKEKQIDAEVLEAARKRDIELDKLNEMEMRKNAAQKGLAGQMQAGATDVAASNDYIQLLNHRAQQQATALKASETALEEIKKKQAEARRERTKLEKHKELMLDQWKIEEKKREAKRTDDMAGTIFMKKRALLEEERLEELARMEKYEMLMKLRALQEMKDKR